MANAASPIFVPESAPSYRDIMPGRNDALLMELMNRQRQQQQDSTSQMREYMTKMFDQQRRYDLQGTGNRGGGMGGAGGSNNNLSQLLAALSGKSGVPGALGGAPVNPDPIKYSGVYNGLRGGGKAQTFSDSADRKSYEDFKTQSGLTETSPGNWSAKWKPPEEESGNPPSVMLPNGAPVAPDPFYTPPTPQTDEDMIREIMKKRMGGF